MAGRFNPNDYETVAQRLQRFWSDHEAAESVTVETRMAHHSQDYAFVLFEANIAIKTDDYERFANGYAYEKAGSGGANNGSHIENCETSAIGRALANLGYGGDKRTTREEMVAHERKSKQFATPQVASEPVGGEVAPASPPANPTASSGLERWPFGKEKGKHISEVGENSLKWFLTTYWPNNPSVSNRMERDRRCELVEAELERRGVTPPARREAPEGVNA